MEVGFHKQPPREYVCLLYGTGCLDLLFVPPPKIPAHGREQVLIVIATFRTAGGERFSVRKVAGTGVVGTQFGAGAKRSCPSMGQ